MPFDTLADDHTRLSRPSIEPTDGPQAADAAALGRPIRMLACAGTCTATLRPEVEAYVQAGIASATKRAYRADLRPFPSVGWDLPATDTQITAYLADHAAVLKVSTLDSTSCGCLGRS